jgi:hypothetical protein
VDTLASFANTNPIKFLVKAALDVRPRNSIVDTNIGSITRKIEEGLFHTYGTSCSTPCDDYLNYLTPILIQHVDIYSFTPK